MNREELLYMLAIHRTSLLRPREKLLLLELASTAKGAFDMIGRSLSGIILRPFAFQKFDKAEILSGAEADLDALSEGPLSCVSFWEPGYPPQLREIYDPPLILFYRGCLPGFSVPLVGIVGTRKPTGAARDAAYRLGYEFGARGFPVVSGLACGIDGEAHRGTLEAGGTAVAVLGCGADIVYPASNRGLAERIIEGHGVLVSEYPPGTPPRKHHFPARNRIISGLSRSTVVCEAPEGSGALITAHYALEQGRDIYVHSVGTRGANALGTSGLVQAGARVISGVPDVLSDWNWDKEGVEQTAPVLQNPASGPQMAKMLEMELEGDCINYNGKVFRRD
jgi:DNA processing protein